MARCTNSYVACVWMVRRAIDFRLANLLVGQHVEELVPETCRSTSGAPVEFPGRSASACHNLNSTSSSSVTPRSNSWLERRLIERAFHVRQLSPALAISGVPCRRRVSLLAFLKQFLGELLVAHVRARGIKACVNFAGFQCFGARGPVASAGDRTTADRAEVNQLCSLWPNRPWSR